MRAKARRTTIRIVPTTIPTTIPTRVELDEALVDAAHAEPTQDMHMPVVGDTP
jgi:hypothetical protein